MAKRVKQYRLRMTEEEFEKLEKLSRELNAPKSTIIRHALKNSEMTLHYLARDRKAIREAFNGGFTHAVYADTDSIKSTKPNIEPIGGAKN